MNGNVILWFLEIKTEFPKQDTKIGQNPLFCIVTWNNLTNTHFLYRVSVTGRALRNSVLPIHSANADTKKENHSLDMINPAIQELSDVLGL